MQRVHCYYRQHFMMTAKDRAEMMARFVAFSEQDGLELAGIFTDTVDSKSQGLKSLRVALAIDGGGLLAVPALLHLSPPRRGQRRPSSRTGRACAASPVASMAGAQDGAATVLVLEAASVSRSSTKHHDRPTRGNCATQQRPECGRGDRCRPHTAAAARLHPSASTHH